MGFGPSMAPPTLRPSEVDNLVQWHEGTGRRGFVESYFLKWNLPALVDDWPNPCPFSAFWLKFTFLQPNEDRAAPVGEVWAMAFDKEGKAHVAEKSTHPQSAWKLERDNCFIRFGDSEFRHGESQGEIQGGKNTIRWSVQWETRVCGLRQLPFDWMYTRKLPKNKLTTPVPDTQMSGWIEINGERHEFSGAPGMQGHNWGESHAPVWAWVHTNTLKGEGRALFEGVSSRIKMGPIKVPWSTILYMEYDGEPILLNRPVTMMRATTDISGLKWTFGAQNKTYRLEGSFEAPASDFIGVNYYNPDGTIVRCLNSKIASGEIRLFRDGALIDSFTCERSAALEFGRSGDTCGVDILIP